MSRDVSSEPSSALKVEGRTEAPSRQPELARLSDFVTENEFEDSARIGAGRVTKAGPGQLVQLEGGRARANASIHDVVARPERLQLLYGLSRFWAEAAEPQISAKAANTIDIRRMNTSAFGR